MATPGMSVTVAMRAPVLMDRVGDLSLAELVSTLDTQALHDIVDAIIAEGQVPHSSSTAKQSPTRSQNDRQGEYTSVILSPDQTFQDNSNSGSTPSSSFGGYGPTMGGHQLLPSPPIISNMIDNHFSASLANNTSSFGVTNAATTSTSRSSSVDNLKNVTFSMSTSTPSGLLASQSAVYIHPPTDMSSSFSSTNFFAGIQPTPPLSAGYLHTTADHNNQMNSIWSNSETSLSPAMTSLQLTSPIMQTPTSIAQARSPGAMRNNARHARRHTVVGVDAVTNSKNLNIAPAMVRRLSGSSFSAESISEDAGSWYSQQRPSSMTSTTMDILQQDATLDFVTATSTNSRAKQHHADGRLPTTGLRSFSESHCQLGGTNMTDSIVLGNFHSTTSPRKGKSTSYSASMTLQDTNMFDFGQLPGCFPQSHSQDIIVPSNTHHDTSPTLSNEPHSVSSQEHLLLPQPSSTTSASQQSGSSTSSEAIRTCADCGSSQTVQWRRRKRMTATVCHPVTRNNISVRIGDACQGDGLDEVFQQLLIAYGTDFDIESARKSTHAVILCNACGLKDMYHSNRARAMLLGP